MTIPLSSPYSTIIARSRAVACHRISGSLQWGTDGCIKAIEIARGRYYKTNCPTSVFLCRAEADSSNRLGVSTKEKVSSVREGQQHEGGSYPAETGVIVVGAGLAGLAAARHLAKSGIPFLLLEASDGVGGRVRTDSFQGFLLDRGFQIFITAYPEASRVLDFESLNLKDFYAGASIWLDGRFHRVADPFRHFADSLSTIANPIGTIVDKILVGIVRFRAALTPVDNILSAPETTIAKRLEVEGFSKNMVDRFFRPFFGGIFFDTGLETTSRVFDFVFRCLALGSNTLPSSGIGAISDQLASSLPKTSVYLNSKVRGVVETQDTEKGFLSGVIMANGAGIKAKYGVILAVEGPEAGRLLNEKLPRSSSVRPPRSTVCLYFSADKCCSNEPILYLNGSGKGIVNNMFFPTTVAPSYGPPGKTLVSITLIGLHRDKSDEQLEQEVKRELSDWFGSEDVDAWQHLRTYRISYAQPDQAPPTNLQKEPRIGQGIYVCGDHMNSSTFDGALLSGRRAVEALLEECNLL